MSIIFSNGKYIHNSLARIDPADRGFLLGDGVFETLRCYQGIPFALLEHWNRLQKSLALLKIPCLWSLPELAKIIKQLLQQNDLINCDAALRITITRGAGPRGLLPPKNPKANLLITCSPLSTLENIPISLVTSSYRRNEYSPLTQHKTLCYLENVLAQQEANTKGFDDALILNTQHCIASTSAANIFLVKDKALYTPSLLCGALPGITRRQIFDIGKQLSIPIHCTALTQSHIYEANEVFISNSLIEIRSVSHIDNVFFKTYPIADEILHHYHLLTAQYVAKSGL